MSTSSEDLSFLYSLSLAAPELRELLGDRWPDFERLLDQARQRLRRDPDGREGLRRDLDAILDLGLASPAAESIRGLLEAAQAVPQRSQETGSPASRWDLPGAEVRRLQELRELSFGEATRSSRFDVDLALSGRWVDEDTAEERRISVWIGEQKADPPEPLRLGEAYTLLCKVGSPVAASLVTGPDSLVRPSDVPDAGLETRWMITSTTVELAAFPGDSEVSAAPLSGVAGWQASFPLRIPREGESAVPRLRITPRSVANPTLEVVIHARREVYRQLTIRLAVERRSEEGSATIAREVVAAPARHLDLRTLHEWTTPPGTLTLSIVGDRATVFGTIGGWQEVVDVVPWLGGDGQIAGRIVNLRAAAEKLRTRTEGYLNAIDPADLLTRLASFAPQYDWGQLHFGADAAHEQEWARVAGSPELRDLAFHGYNLYNAFFPQGSLLRGWLDSLSPGHRLNLSWLRESGAGWLAHVPWGLLYRTPSPPAGQPVDPLGFLGLRLRIAYSSHRQDGTKALGRVEETFHAHLMYWGDDAPTGPEALWQRALFKDWGRQIFLPALPTSADPKRELVELLDSPEASAASPLTVLYLFCNCTVGDGNEPLLRFANTNQAAALLRQTELGQSALADRPLVFANACTTAAADPYFANELAASFFERGCRAFLGTETKVPIELASRFAAIFFHFFFRRVDPAPIAAGEAVAQARLFLWTQYRNLGGLFYTCVNRYELFMARDDEVAALRS